MTTNVMQNDPNQSQFKPNTKPNKPNFPKASNERKLNCDKGLPRYLPLWSLEKQTQNKPNQTCPEQPRMEPISKSMNVNFCST
jgi:hypothetical protein